MPSLIGANCPLWGYVSGDQKWPTLPVMDITGVSTKNSLQLLKTATLTLHNGSFSNLKCCHRDPSSHSKDYERAESPKKDESNWIVWQEALIFKKTHFKPQEHRPCFNSSYWKLQYWRLSRRGQFVDTWYPLACAFCGEWRALFLTSSTT